MREKKSVNITTQITKLTDEQWVQIAPLLPKYRSSPKGGRPLSNPRAVLEGILWVLSRDAPWQALPSGYASSSTCWRWYQKWRKTRVLRKILKKLFPDTELPPPAQLPE